MTNKKTANEALADKIAAGIINCQQKLAGKLNRLAGKYPRKQQAVAFAALGICFGLYCLYLLYTAIF